MSAIFRLTNRTLLEHGMAINQALRLSRQIKTSTKKDETAAVAVPPLTKEEFASPKNWVSYGFDYKNQKEDTDSSKASFFFSVTLCLVWGTFVWAYLPDSQLRDWSQREAYLELRRREQAGVDLVNPNYVDPASFNLPSDDELGDTEIII